MSKMRKTILGLIAGVATMATGVLAQADMILFPYFNSNPGNVVTLISVINAQNQTYADYANPGTIIESQALHYRYFHKKLNPGCDTAACDEVNFCRPTTWNDIVTFDAAGTMEGSGTDADAQKAKGYSIIGTAMFNDATSYQKGANNPYFDLPHFGYKDARIGYLLVGHARTVENCTVEAGSGKLDGEALLVDIVNGSAWGYRAVLKSNQTALAAYGPSDNGTAAAYPQYDALYTNDPQPVAIYAPEKVTNKFIATPVDGDMFTLGKGGKAKTTFQFGYLASPYWSIAPNLFPGLFERNEQQLSDDNTCPVTCVATFDFKQVGILWDTWFERQGGWTYINIPSATDSAAIVYKLIYGTGLTKTGTLDNAIEIRSHRGGKLRFF